MIRVNSQPCAAPGRFACRACRLRAPKTWRSLNAMHIERERSSHNQVLESCAFVTAPSLFLAERIAQSSSCRPVVVYNGIDTNVATPSPTNEKPYVLFASRPVGTKGYTVALQAFARPELEQYQLRVAGLSRPVSAPNVIILGQQPANRMPGLIAGASCIIVPSIWPENCPMIILEALRAGVPIVASRIGGIPELIEDGVTGLLIPPADPVALAEAISRACKDQTLQRSARQVGPVVVGHRFSRDIMISQLELLYAAQGDETPAFGQSVSLAGSGGRPMTSLGPSSPS